MNRAPAMLRPLTAELPKPLVPVGDRPAVAHVAACLAAAGVREAVLNIHHLAAEFTAERLAALPLALRVIHEPEILGTAGGLANAAALLGSTEYQARAAHVDALVDAPVDVLCVRRGTQRRQMRDGGRSGASGRRILNRCVERSEHASVQVMGCLAKVREHCVRSDRRQDSLMSRPDWFRPTQSLARAYFHDQKRQADG